MFNWMVQTSLRNLLFVLVFALLLMGLHVLPTLGTAVGLMLVPAFTSGFVRATALVEQGKFPLPHVLVMDWIRSPTLRLRMLGLGALYLLSIVIIMLVWLVIVTVYPPLALRLVG